MLTSYGSGLQPTPQPQTAATAVSWSGGELPDAHIMAGDRCILKVLAQGDGPSSLPAPTSWAIPPGLSIMLTIHTPATMLTAKPAQKRPAAACLTALAQHSCLPRSPPPCPASPATAPAPHFKDAPHTRGGAGRSPPSQPHGDAVSQGLGLG